MDVSISERDAAVVSALVEQVAEEHGCLCARAWPVAGFDFVLIKGASVYAVAHIVLDHGGAPEGSVGIPKTPVEAMRRYREEHGVQAFVFVVFGDEVGFTTVDDIVGGGYPEGWIGPRAGTTEVH